MLTDSRQPASCSVLCFDTYKPVGQRSFTSLQRFPGAQVYAYGGSALQAALLRLFVRCEAVLPGLWVGTLTRESIIGAPHAAAAALHTPLSLSRAADAAVGLYPPWSGWLSCAACRWRPGCTWLRQGRLRGSVHQCRSLRGCTL